MRLIRIKYLNRLTALIISLMNLWVDFYFYLFVKNVLHLFKLVGICLSSSSFVNFVFCLWIMKHSSPVAIETNLSRLL